MTTTFEPVERPGGFVPPSGRRTGATWVAATGAFLLLASAAVFIAVRWQQIPDWVKLAMVLAMTASFLFGGRALKRTLPATGDVLFHLGAFLLLVDLAAVGLDVEADWRELLLAEGVLGVVALGGLAVATGSVVLRWAGIASVMVVAAGLAALTPIPATLALACVAVAVESALSSRTSGHSETVAHARGAVVAWAAVAGLAPVIGAALALVVRVGPGTLAELGAAGSGAGLAASMLIAGFLAAAVLAHRAREQGDLVLAYLSLASFGTAVGAAMLAGELPTDGSLIVAGGVFATMELSALLTSRDPFWSHLLRPIAEVAETIALATAVIPGLVLLVSPFFRTGSAGVNEEIATALALAALGWFTADMRRAKVSADASTAALIKGGAWAPSTVAFAITLAAAVEMAFASNLTTGISMVTIAGLLTLAERPGSRLVAAVFGPWALVLSAGHPVEGALIGLAGAAVLAEAAVRSSRRAERDGAEILLALLAVGTALFAVAVSLPSTGKPGVVCAAVTVSWLFSLLLDRGGAGLGDVGRAALLVPAATAFALDPAPAIVALAAVTLLYGIDAFRLDRPHVGIGGAIAVQALVAQVAAAAGLSAPGIGLALCVSAIVWTGFATVVDERWRLPFTVAAGCGVGLGLQLTSADPQAFSTALLVTGAIGIGTGLATGNLWLGHSGGLALTLGIGGHLALEGVTAIEPYLLTVAAQLLILGAQARHRSGVSSWLAYTPSVAILGGTALAQRLDGAASWHALVAGAVGVLAVAAGGWYRLAGPMVVGTALLVAVTLNETLSALAGVPTWAWLALGGSILLAAGIALERSDKSPGEAGRRIVDVLAERYG